MDPWHAEGPAVSRHVCPFERPVSPELPMIERSEIEACPFWEWTIHRYRNECLD